MSNAKIKILLVEDDINLGTVLKEFLSVKGFEVLHSLNGDDALKIFKQNRFDICVLDVMMPKVDGFTLANNIKQISEVPFIFVTAKSMLDDKIEGFKLGADDYITKPFSMEELILRINAVLKRISRENESAQKTEYKIGNYFFNFDKRILTHNGKDLKLTSKEAELLKLLCQNKNDLVERSDALKKIWKDESYFTSRSMDVYITKLRAYLKSDPAIQIVNVHGSGFKLIVD
ncbi:MAG: response regulator transcription factor [Ignavibacteria bacterium]|nr:response regulator transcription factor [Ignavibacteria bacterium]